MPTTWPLAVVTTTRPVWVPAGVPAGIVADRLTIEVPPAVIDVLPGSVSDHAPGAAPVGIARLPSDGCPGSNVKVAFWRPAPGAAWTTKRCVTVDPAVTAPICQLPWKSRCPVPNASPEPE